MSSTSFCNKTYVIKNKGYNTLRFMLIFPCSYDYEDLYKLNYLGQLISNTCSKYNTEQKFKLEKQRKMIINSSFDFEVYNGNLYLKFSLTVPDPKKIKSFSLEDALIFFKEYIYFPNVKNGMFDIKQFEREKEYLTSQIKGRAKDIYDYAYQRFINHCDDVGIIKGNIFNDLSKLNKNTPSSIYQYYKKVILDNNPVSIIYGDINEGEVNLFESIFDKTIKNINLEKKDNLFFVPRKKVLNIEESGDSNQSFLYVSYKLKNMNQKYKIYFLLLHRLLYSTETDFIFNNLRVKNNLVYSSKVVTYSSNGLMYVIAYINKDCKERALKVIEQTLDALKDKKFLQESISKILKGFKYYIIRKNDDKYSKLYDFVDSLISDNYTCQKEYELYRKMDVDLFIEFLNNLELDTVYFLRGK